MADTVNPSEEQVPNEAEQTTEQQEDSVLTSLSNEELLQLQGQVTDFREKYLRGLADSENMRKRLQKERQEQVQYAVQSALVDFLSPIDHLENALKFAEQATPEIQHWAVGFQMILGQFKEALSNNGVAPFVSVGTPFDHDRHEAVEMVATSDYPPGTVVEESLRGYKMGEKIIRPARVKVAKDASVESENDEESLEDL